MTDKNDDKGATPGTGQGGKPVDPKRPHATLDLKAVEVASKTVKPEPAKADSGVPSKPAEPAKTADAAKVEPAKTDAKSGPVGATSGVVSGANKPSEPSKSDVKATDPKADIGKPKVTPPVPPLMHVKKVTSFGSLVASALAGVLGGTAAFYGLQNYGAALGFPMAATDTKSGEALTKIAELKKLMDDKTAASPVTAELSAKLTAAQAQIAKLEVSAKSVADLSAAQAKLSADAKALADKLAEQTGSDGPSARVAKLEERLKLISDAATGDPQAGKLPQIAALSGRIVDMESTLTSQVSALRATVSQELERRLALTNETSEAAKSGTNRMDREVSTLKAEVAATTQKFETVRSDTDRLSSAVQAMRDDTNAIKTGLDAIKSDVEAKYKAAAKPADVASAVAPMAGKLTALEANVATVVKAEDERKTNSERILLALELNNLKRVLDRGQPFAAELAAVTKAAGGKFDLAVLDSYKNGTVPTLAELTRDFRDRANSMIDAEAADSADTSIMGRMLDGAKSVIRVRRVDLKPDDKSAEATVGRMERALKESRIGDVMTEAAALPAKSQAAGQAWLDKVKARAAVDQAIATLEAALKTSLGGGTAAVAAPPKSSAN